MRLAGKQIPAGYEEGRVHTLSRELLFEQLFYMFHVVEAVIQKKLDLRNNPQLLANTPAQFTTQRTGLLADNTHHHFAL